MDESLFDEKFGFSKVFCPLAGFQGGALKIFQGSALDPRKVSTFRNQDPSVMPSAVRPCSMVEQAPKPLGLEVPGGDGTRPAMTAILIYGATGYTGRLVTAAEVDDIEAMIGDLA